MLQRYSLALLFALSLPAVLYAQAITASHLLTAGQRAALVKLTATENARRAALTPPGNSVTLQQYADAACRDVFTDYANLEDEAAAREAAVIERFKRASPAQRAAALAQLPPE